MGTFLPDQTHISRVHLRTGDLKRALGFYRDALGLVATQRNESEATVSAAPGAAEIIHISEETDAIRRPPGTTGLFHTALRFPQRADLGRTVSGLVRRGYPLEGAADHGVSEAVYLRDPDGNGVELYVDRPRSEWPMGRGELEMVSEPLALDELLQAADTERANSPSTPDIGHIHLNVGDLSAAERFFGEFLGLAVTQRSYPGALFLAAGGYHHHLGLNVWGGKKPAPQNSLGLVSYRLEVPVAEILYCLRHRAPLLGYEAQLRGGPTPVLQILDPNGTWLEVQCSAGVGGNRSGWESDWGEPFSQQCRGAN